MTRGGRVSFAVFLAFVILSASAVTGAVVAVRSMTPVVVDVKTLGHRGGGQVHLEVPGALARFVLFAVPGRIDCGESEKLARCLPIIRAVSKSLADAPDCVLLSVEGPREWVRVAKEGRELLLNIETDEESVSVRFPMRLAEAVARKLARGGTSA